MLDCDAPGTGHGRLHMVRETAWLAAVQLRKLRPEAALVCDAIDVLVDMLASLAVDRDGTYIKVAAFVASALRQYQCDVSLHEMLEAAAGAAGGAVVRDGKSTGPCCSTGASAVNVALKPLQER